MTRRLFLKCGAIGLAGASSGLWWASAPHAEAYAVTHTDAEWRKLLTPEQYSVLRQSGTEHPFSTPLLHEKRRGNFACAGCNLELFSLTTNSTAAPVGRVFWAPLRMRSPRSGQLVRYGPHR